MAAVEGSLRIRQYVYFALESETVPASSITERLGVRPDVTRIRGAQQAAPPLPVCHSWAVECRLPGLAVDEQVTRVLARVRPVADKIRALTATGSISAVMQIVRYLASDEGESERTDVAVTRDGVVLEKLPGQHHLLGWHLASEDLALLASLSADLDVDEYGG